MPCGFESHLSHQKEVIRKDGLFFIVSVEESLKAKTQPYDCVLELDSILFSPLTGKQFFHMI